MIRVHHVDHETALRTLQFILAHGSPKPVAEDTADIHRQTLLSEWLSVIREFDKGYHLVETNGVPGGPLRLQRSV